MWFRDINTPDVAHIAANMREWDRREIFATRFGDDIDEFVLEASSRGPLAWTVGLGNEPIAAFGCHQCWPGMWSLWFFATDKLDTIGLSVTRLIIRAILPAIRGDDTRRIECRSMEGHDDAQRWLTVIGATREATLKGFGRDGDDFHVYTWEPR
jgi:hypothetical protein